ncbi:hypothetical protein [Tunicatimonas pelagia]|uniref:hypothetical protein n=1 Tax=Tunicatimonas pelagia TaxID=931531 RepID=UPI002665B441|nr:hypothetical protein [Tunicatimonas pelagia]WKN41971.1 hypothetical protein P0M28_23295 [Tunicatimonas pelagia]
MSVRQIAQAPPELVDTSTDRNLFRHEAIKLSILYLICWATVYFETPLPVRFGVTLLLVFIQLSSYYYASIIMLMAIFIPFFNIFFDNAISGVTITRLLFALFFILSLNKKKLRELQIDSKLLVLAMIALVTLQLSSSYQILFKNMPISGDGSAAGYINVLAIIYDNVVIVLFLYFAYTRLPFAKLNHLVNFVILLAILEAASLLFVAVQNADQVFGSAASDLNRNILWLNPMFGHKNDWSMILVFIFLLVIVRNIYVKEYKVLYYLTLGVVLPAIAISLSRQAYVWCVLVFLVVSWLQKDFRFVGYLSVIVLLVVLFQPDFILQRIQSMLEVRNVEDFQELNRKVSDLAIDQAVGNFTIVPRMFFQNWEYNWSEGFWNGFLHQQGIIGLLYTVFLYFFIYRRYSALSKIKKGGLYHYCIILMTAIVLMFLANFNRRYTHFMHYKGDIGQIGFLVMFLIFYAELIYSAIRRKLANLELLK